MKRLSIAPKNIESIFKENEMFFSSTNLKGVILSGNSVFTRVSKYSIDEMVGKPHNIIRHPDMPKVVFKLLWDYIQKGKPIVAYVKNMAKDGSYYWVLATVFPVFDEEGNMIKYLSIRIKPTTDYFRYVENLYLDILKIEKQYGMEKAQEYLLERLKSLGFKDYDDFMIKAFISELKDKIPYLKVKDNKEHKPVLKGLLFQIYKIIEIFEETDKIMNMFSDYRNILGSNAKSISSFTEDIRIIALNASVESLRLGSSGIVFSVLSQEMRKSAESSAKYIRLINETIEKASFSIREIIFYLGMTNLQILMVKDLIINGISDDFEKDILDFKYILRTSLNNLKKNRKMLDELTSQLEKITTYIDKVLALFEKLEFLHVNGKIESAYLEEVKFNIIFNQVKELVHKSQQSILEIIKPTEKIQKGIVSFKNKTSKIETHLDIALKQFDTIKIRSNLVVNSS
ncbi:MAG: PAS domain-containing protein [Aquificae bacterium]|nr:PAS domain-containing protein [Aquificota bacterium]